MCLAVPGEVLDVTEDEGALLVGRVRFGTVVQRVCLVDHQEFRFAGRGGGFGEVLSQKVIPGVTLSE
ncbi:hypothetical protein L6R50_25055 [Myxococcota bacterium]|nr:hypothetical protein [Myxococcota bacterium]